MTNVPLMQLDQFTEIRVKNAYNAKTLTGKMPEAQFLAESNCFRRDNSRMPMP